MVLVVLLILMPVAPPPARSEDERGYGIAVLPDIYPSLE